MGLSALMLLDCFTYVIFAYSSTTYVILHTLPQFAEQVSTDTSDATDCSNLHFRHKFCTVVSHFNTLIKAGIHFAALYSGFLTLFLS